MKSYKRHLDQIIEKIKYYFMIFSAIKPISRIKGHLVMNKTRLRGFQLSVDLTFVSMDQRIFNKTISSKSIKGWRNFKKECDRFEREIKNGLTTLAQFSTIYNEILRTRYLGLRE